MNSSQININKLKNITEILATQRNLLITGHIGPDGDCIGSMLGLFHAFNGAEKGWQMVLKDEVPDYLSFLPEAQRIIQPGQITAPVEMIALLDCSDFERAGGEWLEQWQVPVLVVDHHCTAGMGEADGVMVDATAAATAELVFELADTAQINLSQDAALCLYTAIVFDSGCFRYLNTTPRTLNYASQLLSTGINTEPVRMNLFENKDLAHMRMLGVAFNNLNLTADGLCAWMMVDQKSKDLWGATAKDCSNIVNYSLVIKGVKVAIFFDEREEMVKVSLRCRDGYRVDEIAAAFGGGGHVLAAGCPIEGNLSVAVPLILSAVQKMIGESQGE